MPGRAGHRMRQFFGALRPRVDGDDRADAYRYLNAAQQAVFESMMVRDQEHGIVVFGRVRDESAAEDAALFAAALLHDCGKGRVALWQRVVHVLLPSMQSRIAAEHGSAWRQAFWRLMHHPRLGAEMVAATGADADVVRMIREQDTRAAGANADPRLARLQAADDA